MVASRRRRCWTIRSDAVDDGHDIRHGDSAHQGQDHDVRGVERFVSPHLPRWSQAVAEGAGRSDLMPSMMGMIYGMEIQHTRDRITMYGELNDSYRRIYLDGRKPSQKVLDDPI